MNDPTYYRGCDCGGEHHSTGERAWCLDCHEWCYPDNICEIQSLRVGYAELNEALQFYADPNSYFAIGVFADRPAGEFADDFSDADDWPTVDFPYERPMPGARARAALIRGKK